MEPVAKKSRVENDPESLIFDVHSVTSKEYKKFKRTEKRTVFSIKHNLDNYFTNIFTLRMEIENKLEEMIRGMLSSARSGDLFSVAIINENFETPIYIHPRSVEKFKISTILDRIERLLKVKGNF